jgi:hypothetical protein
MFIILLLVRRWLRRLGRGGWILIIIRRLVDLGGRVM